MSAPGNRQRRATAGTAEVAATRRRTFSGAPERDDAARERSRIAIGRVESMSRRVDAQGAKTRYLCPTRPRSRGINT
ncbi:MAG: hypothetical protein IPQ17_14225 [Xanthomonadales bacterium]|uniref:hypothetical protein n=1 Tax=Dokdonella sp. TaxID=2291710 RepID=UPI002C3A8CF1|nr:hypothetical protein [Xanthomonadales bacterium]HQV73735.1 hypothetical protein [Dokdonella sp.]HQX66606.1 hypothetical protein [Dokdonella sp.]